MKKFSKRKFSSKPNRLTASNNDENDIQKNGNKSSLLGMFDSEPGYYQHIIRPLLAPNHEKELIHWLKATDLLKSEQICSKRTISGMCNSPMDLMKGKSLDLYHWKCRVCSKRKSIRDDSIFSDLSCSLKDAMRIVLAWCKGHHVDFVGSMLGVNDLVIHELYIRAASIAEKYIKTNIKQWQVGGPGIVVIIDTFPEGCTNTSLIRMSRPILCISEVKSVPQKYWLETLDRYTHHNTQQVNSVKEHILRAVQAMVRPGSILITPQTSTLCCYSDFQHLRMLYPTIVSIKDLARHNTDRQNVFSNLETIWKQVLNICEEAQFYCTSYIDHFIISNMWRLVYGNEAFETLLYQISSKQ